jgi:starch-binding outer membrane protein, SusD/RagB family
MRTSRSIAGIASVAVALLFGGCTNWLSVDNPTVIDNEALDPVADIDLLAKSAQQNLAAAYGHLIVYSSWFTGETDVSETFPTRNEFGRRAVSIQNGSLDTDIWFPLSQAVSSSYIVLNTALADTAGNIHYARANLVLAYAYVFMAEQFCQGTVLAGPPLTTQNMLDSALAHFALARSQGNAAVDTGRGRPMARAAWVGTARAELQAGNLAAAIAAADSVPVGFVFNLAYQDDLAQRFRLANRMWFYVRDRGSIAVAPTWRIGAQLAAGVVQNAEPRVPWMIPVASGPTAYAPQDAAYSTDRGIPYAVQQKYPDYTTPVRLASKLEADYIKAEAQGTAAQQTLIGARRTANGQPAYAGATDSASILTEFFTQRGLDFFLEGKRLGDFRRHPANIIGVPVPGSTYWKPGFATVGSDVCFPLPITETDNNPNF